MVLTPLLEDIWQFLKTFVVVETGEVLLAPTGESLGTLLLTLKIKQPVILLAK